MTTNVCDLDRENAHYHEVVGPLVWEKPQVTAADIQRAEVTNIG